MLRDLCLHPNIPQFYGMFFRPGRKRDDDQLWFVMEVSTSTTSSLGSVSVRPWIQSGQPVEVKAIGCDEWLNSKTDHTLHHSAATSSQFCPRYTASRLSFKRLIPSCLPELYESKFLFVSRIEFIRSKLSNFSVHVSGVHDTRPAPPRPSPPRS